MGNHAQRDVSMKRSELRPCVEGGTPTFCTPTHERASARLGERVSPSGDEFKGFYLGAKVNPDDPQECSATGSHVLAKSTVSVPESIDWREKVRVPSVPSTRRLWCAHRASSTTLTLPR